MLHVVFNESEVELMQKAGFADAQWLGMTGFRTSEYTVGAMFKGTKK